MSVHSSPYRELYLREAQRQIELIQESLSRLERVPPERGAMDSLYRAAHTRHGMAATMGCETRADSHGALQDLVLRLHHHPRCTRFAVVRSA